MVYLDKHLKKYPLMQIEDILKLYLQGIFGPAHLVPGYEQALKRVENEYNDIKNINYPYEMIEEISSDYVRVYLKPYYDLNKDFSNLVKVFVLSSKIQGNVELFKKEVRALINEDNKEYIESYLKQDNLLISHSDVYRKNYHPHYLVIHKQYLNSL